MSVATLSDAEHAGHTTEVCICCIAREAFLLAVFAVVVSSPTGFDHGVEKFMDTAFWKVKDSAHFGNRKT